MLFLFTGAWEGLFALALDAEFVGICSIDVVVVVVVSASVEDSDTAGSGTDEFGTDVFSGGSIAISCSSAQSVELRWVAI